MTTVAQGPIHVVRMDVLGPKRRFVPALDRIAEDVDRLRPHVGELPGGRIGRPGDDMDGLEQHAETFFALAQSIGAFVNTLLQLPSVLVVALMQGPRVAPPAGDHH